MMIKLPRLLEGAQHGERGQALVLKGKAALWDKGSWMRVGASKQQAREEAKKQRIEQTSAKAV